MSIKITQESFIYRSSIVHNNFYLYHKSIFKNLNEDLIVICPNHNDFITKPINHLYGNGKCPECLKEQGKYKKLLTTQEYIQKCIKKFGYEKTIYKHVIYTGGKNKIILQCIKNGHIYEQTADDHFHGYGCAECVGLKRITQEDFIESSKLVYGDRLDYSESIFNGTNKRVSFRCIEHNITYLQFTSGHLDGHNGCKECAKKVRSKSRLYNNDIFLENCRNKFGETIEGVINFESFIYNGNDTKGILKCYLEQHVFEQTPVNFLSGKGNCLVCSGEIITNESFKNRCYKKFGYDMFDYDGINYLDYLTDITFRCKRCNNIIFTDPASHLNCKDSCKVCFKKNRIIYNKSNTNEFKEKSFKKYGEIFDLSFVNYINNFTNVDIKCIKHDLIFTIKPSSHLKANGGCPQCASESIGNRCRSNKEEFTNKSILVNGEELYGYQEVIYINSNTKVKLWCIRGEHFFWQMPKHHLSGHGCPICNGSKSEDKFVKLIHKNFPEYDFIRQGKPKWLKRKTNCQSLDVYSENHNIGLEYQGGQHFYPIEIFNGYGGFENQIDLDENKRKLCLENNCKLFYFTYTKKDVPKDYPHKVYTNENELVEAIKEQIEIHKLTKENQLI